MSTNIERAAGIIRAVVRIKKTAHDQDIAHALANAGLLVPDLPEPTSWHQAWKGRRYPVWKVGDLEVLGAFGPGCEVDINNIVSDESGIRFSVDQCADLALALLAAAVTNGAEGQA